MDQLSHSASLLHPPLHSVLTQPHEISFGPSYICFRGPLELDRSLTITSIKSGMRGILMSVRCWLCLYPELSLGSVVPLEHASQNDQHHQFFMNILSVWIDDTELISKEMVMLSEAVVVLGGSVCFVFCQQRRRRWSYLITRCFSEKFSGKEKKTLQNTEIR